MVHNLSPLCKLEKNNWSKCNNTSNGLKTASHLFMNMSISQLELLWKIAAIEPQAAYCAFTADFKKRKVTYTVTAIPDICQYLQKPNHYVWKFLYQLLLIYNRHITARKETPIVTRESWRCGNCCFWLYC